MSRPVYSIRFPLVKERVKHPGRRGPRYRLTVDKTGLEGARACAAGMISSALLYRDAARREQAELRVQIERAGMRVSALWARLFAGQIESEDPRLLAAQSHHSELVARYCGHVQAA